MPERTPPTLVSLSAGSVFKIVGIVALCFLLFAVRDIILIILTSVVIAAAIEPAIVWFRGYHIARLPAVLAVYLLTFLVLFGTLYFLLPPLLTDVSTVATTLPGKLGTIGAENVSEIIPFIKTFDISFADIAAGIQDRLPIVSSNVVSAASAVFGGFFSFVLIIVISFYLAVQERGIENFLRLVTPITAENYVVGLWRRSQRKIGFWLEGQLLLGLLVGMLVFLGLTILQVKYALLLALLAAVFELIPFFGPILSSIPGIILGFSQGTAVGLMTLGLYIIIQQFENHLIYPLVVKKIVGVPAIIVVIALLIGASLAGFLGIILAVPVAAVIMELAGDIEKHKRILTPKPGIES